jgi:hypothetical protein
VTVTYLSLSGYINFATRSAPTAALAERPDGTPDGSIGNDFGVQVLEDYPSGTVTCFLGARTATAIPYYCAMPTWTSGDLTDSPQWYGKLQFMNGHDLTLANSATDATPTSRRICRYTTQKTATAVPSNINHPLYYSAVTDALSNQNYLVIKAGDGTSAYLCPGDDLSTLWINGNTYPHQPQ